MQATRDGGDIACLISAHRVSGPSGPRCVHLAATTWLRHGMGLDEVRRLFGHASLQTTLRYSSLVSITPYNGRCDRVPYERARVYAGIE